MKTTKYFLTSILAFSLCLPMGMALADHGDGGGNPFVVLATEAQELDSMVRYSGLNWRVQSAVSNFSREAGQLPGVCQVRIPFGERPDFIGFEPMDHGDGNQRCSLQMSRVSRAFFPVDRALSDTYYDHRDVYQQYIEVREALRVAESSVGGPINPPPPPPVERQISLTCQSIEFQTTNCNAGGLQITGAEVQYRMSNRACILGSSWGITGDRTAIWVTAGCRAVFLVRGR